MTWEPGRDEIERLMESGELECVTPDARLARRLLADADKHLHTADDAIARDDLSGAYQLAYDALRKSAAALLAVQGLRATSRGGHIAIQDAVGAQFGTTVRAFKSFGRLRRARNNFEYPSTDTSGPTPDDVRDALATATKARTPRRLSSTTTS